MTIPLRRAAVRLLGAGARSDRGSMPLAMLVVVVGMLLSAALVPVVVNQVVSTRTVSGRTYELQAAQTGIDVALAQLRSATRNGKGEVEALPPCILTGSAGDAGSAYRVEIKYYRLGDAGDPVPLDCAERKDYVPVSATLTAVGTGTDGSRTIEATYTFHTNNENITGGAIPLAEPAANPRCMDAGADTKPAPDTPVKMLPCKSSGSSEQRFAYTPDLNIKLIGSETAAEPTGMCVDAPYPRVGGATPTPVKFQPCLGLVARQQWSLNDNGNFRGTVNPANTKEATLCLNLKAPSDLVMGACGGGGTVRVFRPRPEAGAGMASAAVGQLVNYKQFSRCLDVTNHNPNSGYMIVWFCKQDPNGNVSWNQKWSFPPQAASADTAIAERIRTAGTGNPGYCLKSPGSTAAKSYVTMLSCDAAGTLTDESLKWKVFGDTGTYATSYRIMDAYGYCMVPTDLTVAKPDTHGDGTAKVKVATCNSSELQKWNAPANLNQPLVLTNTREK